MKKALFAGLLLALSTVSFSQTVTRCGSNTYLKQLEENFPEEFASIKEAA